MKFNKKTHFFDYLESDLKKLSYKIDKAFDLGIITYSEHYNLWSYLVDLIEEIEDLKNEVQNENK